MPVSGNSFTVSGSITTGVFLASEEVVQANSNATANLIGAVTGSNPMIIGSICGTADGTNVWTGQTSGATYTPTAVPVASAWNCFTPDSEIPWPKTSGRLTIGTVQSGPSWPCCVAIGNRYTGQENQFYRVEIHQPGSLLPGGASLQVTSIPPGTGTFKWSRENASIQTAVTEIKVGINSAGQPATVLTVHGLGRDQVVGFSADNWIEITNQTLDDNCQPGEIYKIDSVKVSSSSITLTGLLSCNFPASSIAANKYTRVSRWDQSGRIYTGDNVLYCDLDATAAGASNPNGFYGIPVPPPGTKLILENGITVEFGLSLPNGVFVAMDYWNFAARTVYSSVDPQLKNAPPRGIWHHRTKLSVVTFGPPTSATDCRVMWASSVT
jgi:hypothetical protein